VDATKHDGRMPGAVAGTNLGGTRHRDRAERGGIFVEVFNILPFIPKHRPRSARPRNGANGVDPVWWTPPLRGMGVERWARRRSWQRVGQRRDRSELVRIDSKKMVVAGRYPLAPCEEPTGLAVDAKHGRLFVGCGNKMMAVVNGTTGKVVTTLAIGPGVDGTEFDPTTGDVFNACGKDGTLSVIHQDTADSYHVVQNLSTQLGARTLAVDTSSHRVFLAAAQFGDKPAPSETTPKPRAPILPGTFVVLVVGK